MKEYKATNVKVAKGNNAAEFEKNLNCILADLRDVETQIEFSSVDPFLCFVFYTQNIKEPETMTEVFADLGAGFYCGHCKHLQTNPDGRVKHHRCALFDTKVRLDTPACEMLYRKIIDREDILTALRGQVEKSNATSTQLIVRNNKDI